MPTNLNNVDYHRLALVVAEMMDVGYSIEWITYLMDVYNVPQNYPRPDRSESKYLFSKALLEDLSLDPELRHIIADFALYILDSERFDPKYEQAAFKHLPIFKKLVKQAGLETNQVDNSADDMGRWLSANHPQIDSYFDDIATLILNSGIEPEIVRVIQSDLQEAQTCYRSGAYKSCVVMLGAALEGIMLGTLRRVDILDYIKAMPSPPQSLRAIGCNSPHLPQLIGEKLRFEDYKNILRELVNDVDKLGVEGIQQFRNAIHPWKSIQEPHIYGKYESARAVHHISALKIIVGLLVNWKP